MEGHGGAWRGNGVALISLATSTMHAASKPCALGAGMAGAGGRTAKRVLVSPQVPGRNDCRIRHCWLSVARVLLRVASKMSQLALLS